MMAHRGSTAFQDHTCPFLRGGCPSPTSTPEELERRAIIQRNDLLLHEAVIKNDTEAVRKILKEPIDVNSRNNDGRTGLHVACEGGHINVAKILLNSGANVEAVDSKGDAPLHVAANHQQTALVKLLLDAGADPDSENEKGSTPLHVACSLGSKGILELLLQHGATLSNQNISGNTPLHMACQSNEVETVEILINKGSDLNCLNKRLQSPIHIAAEMGHSEVCRLLLAAGADIDQREQGGRTPLYIAARGSFTAIVDMIIKTARLDYPSQDIRRDSQSSASRSLRRWRSASKDSGNTVKCAPKDSERLREILYKLAYKHLGPGEWKTLASHWAFTEDQVKAIEHQYNGPSSYKEHGFRMMLIWAYGLSPEANPVKELYDSLVAVGKRPLADSVRRKIDAENEARRKGGGKGCNKCSIS